MEEIGRQHMISLTASNFKRLHAVEIKVDPDDPSGVIVITGKNEAGKSCLLDSIVAALMGKRYVPAEPVRRGEKRSDIVFTTEDLVVECSFTAEGGGSLKVRDREGRPFTSPQKLLDSLTAGEVGFDPLSFARMDAKKQAEKLLAICPVDLDLAANAEMTKRVFEHRRELGVTLKAAQAAFDECPKLEGEAPAAKIVVSEIVKELGGLQETQRIRARAVTDLDRRTAQIARVKEELAEAERAQASAKQTLDGSVDPADKIAGLEKRIETAEASNQAFRSRQARAEKKAALTGAEAAHAKADAEIERLRTERADALKSAKFPVEGLGINEDGVVTYDGIAFSEAATSRQMRVGAALAVHASPTLRLAFARDASLLDADSRCELAEMAKQHDLLILMECVDSDSPAAIEIVDGSTKGAMNE